MLDKKTPAEPLRLHLLRHGETEHSREDRFCGEIDAPLTSAGRRMAQAFADRWGRRDADSTWRGIYTSTRQRAIDTAAPLAARVGIVPEIDCGLDEIGQGTWQGCSKEEIARREPARLRRWMADPTIGAPAGESAFDVSQRALAVVARVRRLHGDGDVLIVAHKTVLRLLICALASVDLRLYRDWIPQPVGSHTVIDLDGDRRLLRRLADLSYLPPALRARALVGDRSSVRALLEPEPTRDFVGEQEAGLGQTDMRLAQGDPTGA
jgi:alpha-ribazole phosphatase